MKVSLLYTLIITSILHSVSISAISCSDISRRLFRSSDGSADSLAPRLRVPELEISEETSKWLRLANILRRVRGGTADEPANLILAKRFISKLDVNLLEGRFASPSRELKLLFHQVHFSYFVIKRHNEALSLIQELEEGVSPEILLSKLRSGNLPQGFIDLVADLYRQSDSSLEQVRKFLSEEVTKKQDLVAKQFYIYKKIESHLLSLLRKENCNEECRSSVQILRSRLGLNRVVEETDDGIVVEASNDYAIYARYVGDDPRPEIDDMKQLFYQIENGREIVEKEALESVFQEIKVLLTNAAFSPILLNRAFSFAINTTPLLHRTRLVRIFKVIYDAQARAIYLPPAIGVIRSTKSIDQQYLMLKQELTVSYANEILIAFARLRNVNTEASETWEQLKLHIKGLKDAALAEEPGRNIRDPRTIMRRRSPELRNRIAKLNRELREMEKAERKADARGDLTIVSRNKNINTLSLAIAAAFTYGSYNVVFDESEVPEQTEGDVSPYDEDERAFEEEMRKQEREMRRGNSPQRRRSRQAQNGPRRNRSDREKKENESFYKSFSDWISEGGELYTRGKKEASEMMARAKNSRFGFFKIHEEEEKKKAERNPSSQKKKGFFHWIKVRFNKIQELMSHPQSLDL